MEKFFYILKIHPLEITTLYEDHTAVPGLYLDTFWLSNDILQLYVSKRTITEYMTMDSLLSNYICLTAKAGIETWKIMCTILHFSCVMLTNITF